MTARFLVVDVGGTDVKWALARDGQLGDVERVPTRRETPQALVDQLGRLHVEAAAGAALPWAVCIAGVVSAGGSVRSGNLGLHDEPLLDRLAEVTERPRLLVNDAAAAAAGEAAGGTLALVQIGSGLAGRIVLDGEVVSGVNGLAGEVGHVVFVPGGRRCRCGRAGCVEAYAGLAALRERYAELGRPAPSARQLLLDAAADADAAAVLDDAVAAVAFAAAVVVSASDPGTLRLGGGVAAQWGETLRSAVLEGLARLLLEELVSRTRVELSELRERAPLLGLLQFAGVISPSGG
jgi:glucokinase